MAFRGSNLNLSAMNNPDATEFKQPPTGKLSILTKNYKFNQKYTVGPQIDGGGQCKKYQLEHNNQANKPVIMKDKCSSNNDLSSSNYMLPNNRDVCYGMYQEYKYEIKRIYPRMTGNLYQLLTSKPSFNHGENTEPIRYVLNSIVPALDQLHEDFGIIHNNLKPENLLFSRKDGQIKICDFTLFNQNSNGIFQTKDCSFNYQSPEEYFHQEYDFASVAFSLGRTVQAFVDIQQEDQQELHFGGDREEDINEKCRWYDMIGSLEVSLLCDGLVDGKLYLLKCDGFKYSSYSKKSVTQLFQRPRKFPHYKSIGELMIGSLYGDPKARPRIKDWRRTLNGYRDTSARLNYCFRLFIQWRGNYDYGEFV